MQGIKSRNTNKVMWYLGVNADECICVVIEFFFERNDNALKCLLRLFFYVACHLVDNINITIKLM